MAAGNFLMAAVFSDGGGTFSDGGGFFLVAAEKFLVAAVFSWWRRKIFWWRRIFPWWRRNNFWWRRFFLGGGGKLSGGDGFSFFKVFNIDSVELEVYAHYAARDGA